MVPSSHRIALGVAFILSMLLPLPVLAQTEDEVEGAGQICSAGSCYPFNMTFSAAGGPVEGYVEGSQSVTIPEAGVTIGSSFIGHFTGVFEGGPDGSIGGQWEIVSTLQVPAELASAGYPTSVLSSGSWSGTLGGTGSGSGSYSGSDSFGMPVSGTWSLNYDPSALVEATPTPIPATPTPRPSATPTAVPAPRVTPSVSLQTLLDFLQRQRTLMQSGLETWRPLIAPWFDGQLVTIGVDEDGQAFVVDVYGRRTSIDENGLPLAPVEGPTTPSQSNIAEHPDFDWGAWLEDYGPEAWQATKSLLQPDTPWLDRLSSYLAFLDQSSEQPFPDIPEDEWASIAAEVSMMMAQENNRQDCQAVLGESVCDPNRELDLHDPSDYAIWRQQQKERNRHHYVELMGYFSQEEYDQLLDSGIDPQQAVNSRRSLNVALRTINQKLGTNAIAHIEESFGLDPKAARQLRDRLIGMGADPEKAGELARASQCLRVITTLGAEHTVSNDGMLNGLFRFFDSWVVRSQAIDLTINNLDNLTDEQIALIEDANGPALVRALQNTQLAEDDPVYRLIMEQIQGGQQ